MNHPPSLHRRAAWTLIEFLVVIAILAVLLAVMLPVSGRVRDEARAAACMSNMRVYGNAVMAFIADNNQSLPDLTTEALVEERELDYGAWVEPYIGQPMKELRCPIATAKDRQSNDGFAYNGNGALPETYPRLSGIPVPRSRVVLAAEMYTWVDAFSASGHMNRTVWGNGNGGANPADEGTKRRAQYHGSPKHRSIHLYFLDGHVKRVSAPDNDWSRSPVLGDATNGGYFYTLGQFTRMKTGKLVVQ